MEIVFDDKFDWIPVLEGLSGGEQVGREDKLKLDSMASQWPTCACGQLCKLLPRDRDKRPEDSMLSILGGQFYQAVQKSLWGEALEIFHKIEARSDKLLKDMGVIPMNPISKVIRFPLTGGTHSGGRLARN
jgi:hypothetical protein